MAIDESTHHGYFALETKRRQTHVKETDRSGALKSSPADSSSALASGSCADSHATRTSPLKDRVMVFGFRLDTTPQGHCYLCSYTMDEQNLTRRELALNESIACAKINISNILRLITHRSPMTKAATSTDPEIPAITTATSACFHKPIPDPKGQL